MNVELMSVLAAVTAVGIGLAGLILASGRGLRHEMRDMRRETREEIQDLRHEMRATRLETRQEIQAMRQETRQDIREMRQEIQELRQEMRQEVQDMRGQLGRVDSHIGELRERTAGLEGLLTGLREAIVRRAVAS